MSRGASSRRNTLKSQRQGREGFKSVIPRRCLASWLRLQCNSGGGRLGGALFSPTFLFKRLWQQPGHTCALGTHTSVTEVRLRLLRHAGCEDRPAPGSLWPLLFRQSNRTPAAPPALTPALCCALPTCRCRPGAERLQLPGTRVLQEASAPASGAGQTGAPGLALCDGVMCTAFWGRLQPLPSSPEGVWPTRGVHRSLSTAAPGAGAVGEGP